MVGKRCLDKAAEFTMWRKYVFVFVGFIYTK